MRFQEDPPPTTPGAQVGPAEPAGRWPYLTTLAGDLPGRMFRFRDPATTLGRAPDRDIHFMGSGVSRRHAVLRRTADGEVEILDEDSTNGTWVNGERVQARTLQDGDKLQLGPTVMLRYNLQDAVDEAFQRRQFEAMTRDALTGCHNRMYFEEELRRELAFGARTGRPVALAMLDVDHFKDVNDSYGHAVGDAVLAEVGRALTSMMRPYDRVARVGGEEFALLMRDADLDTARSVGERVRLSIGARRIVTADSAVSVTVSVGVASLSEQAGADGPQLMRAADARLYRAKEAGRNRTISDGPFSPQHSPRPRPPYAEADTEQVQRHRLKTTRPLKPVDEP